jgi:hypothetical protein
VVGPRARMDGNPSAFMPDVNPAFTLAIGQIVAESSRCSYLDEAGGDSSHHNPKTDPSASPPTDLDHNATPIQKPQPPWSGLKQLWRTDGIESRSRCRFATSIGLSPSVDPRTTRPRPEGCSRDAACFSDWFGSLLTGQTCQNPSNIVQSLDDARS